MIVKRRFYALQHPRFGGRQIPAGALRSGYHHNQRNRRRAEPVLPADFETEQLLGWYKPSQRVHVGHGMIRFKDKKMSTRKGNVVWLETVLQEAHDRVAAMAAEGLEGGGRAAISDEEIWKLP